MTGTFIAFEGPEGGGKSLQLLRLADRLRGQGHGVVQTREPGGTPIGDEIRTMLLRQEGAVLHPETEVLLLAAARAQHVRDVIGPGIERGDIVLCDRFTASTFAYQGAGHSMDLQALQPIQEFATGGLQPDVTILLDLPVEIGLARRFADAAQVNRIDLASREFHDRVRTSFLAQATENPDRWIVIDARDDPDSVQLAIWSRLQERWPSRIA